MTSIEAHSLLNILTQLKNHNSGDNGNIYIGDLYWAKSEILSLEKSLKQFTKVKRPIPKVPKKDRLNLNEGLSNKA